MVGIRGPSRGPPPLRPVVQGRRHHSRSPSTPPPPPHAVRGHCRRPHRLRPSPSTPPPSTSAVDNTLLLQSRFGMIPIRLVELLKDHRAFYHCFRACMEFRVLKEISKEFDSYILLMAICCLEWRNESFLSYGNACFPVCNGGIYLLVDLISSMTLLYLKFSSLALYVLQCRFGAEQEPKEIVVIKNI